MSHRVRRDRPVRLFCLRRLTGSRGPAAGGCRVEEPYRAKRVGGAVVAGIVMAAAVLPVAWGQVREEPFAPAEQRSSEGGIRDTPVSGRKTPPSTPDGSSAVPAVERNPARPQNAADAARSDWPARPPADEPHADKTRVLAGVAALVGIACCGLLLILLVIIWGHRARRWARRRPTPPTAVDEFWYLRPKRHAGERTRPDGNRATSSGRSDDSHAASREQRQRPDGESLDDESPG